MIERLDSHDQPLFTTVEGRQPYFAKWVKPIVRLRYADTVYNVRSKGMNATWFSSADGLTNDRSTSYAGFIPILKQWYGGGQPEVFVNEQVAEWGIKYHGYFLAPITADYTFSFAGEGEIVDFQVATVVRLNVDSGRAKLGINQPDYASTVPFSLNGMQWYAFNLKYKKRFNDRNSGFIAFWQTDSASVTPDKIVVSAGVMTPTLPLEADTPFPVAFESLTGFNNTELQVEKLRGSTLKFSVPFVSSNSPNFDGFRYQATNDAYIKVSSTFSLKKYRMIEYSEGYQDATGANQFVVRFTGQIRDFDIKYKNDGNDTLQVNCNDYTVFTKDAINLVAPTPLDYWQAGYIRRIPRHVNGQSKPRAFDGWQIHRAYKVLLTESFIDPWTMYKRQIRNNINDIAVSGQFYIEPISSSAQSYLPTQPRYGNPNVIIRQDLEPDDEYLFKISTGEFYQDVIDDIMKPWFYVWGMNRYGEPFLRRNEVPTRWITHKDFDWDITPTTDLLDLGAFKGSYSTSNIVSISSARFTGTRADVILVAGPQFGSSDPSVKTIQVQIKDEDYNVVQTTNINTHNSTAWFFYEGADPNIGINPTQIQVADNLDYDEYICFINNTDALFQVGINALLVYDKDINRPNEFFYTGDVTTAGSVKDLEVKAPTKDQRTDAIVLGALQGTRVNENQFTNNNPVLTYIQSSARDINSVYKSTANNYVGRPRITIIQDSKISSQDQADFIAFNLIDQFSSPSKPISFTVAGHPKIEVDDLVVVTDDFKAGVDTSNFAWVTSYTNSFNKGIFSTKIDTTPVQPAKSFWDKVEPDVADFPNPILNFRIYNQGAVSNESGLVGVPLMKDMNVASSTAWVGTNVSWLPNKGFFEISQIQSQNPAPGSLQGPWNIFTERCKYEGVLDDGSGNYALTGVVRDLRGNISTSWVGGPDSIALFTDGETATATRINIAWDPYTSERMGINPYMTFDLARSGSIRVHIKSNVTNNAIGSIVADQVVDALTNVEQDNPELAFSEIVWGENKRYVWGGMDRYGLFNQSVPTDNKLEFGVYVKDSHIHQKRLYTDVKNPYQIVAPSQIVQNYKPLTKGIHSDFRSLGYSKFYIEIEFIPDNENDTPTTFSSLIATASSFFNKDDQHYRFFSTHLDDVPIIDLYISTAGLKRWNHEDKTLDDYASTFPHVNRNGERRDLTSDSYKKVDPVYITNSSNENKGLEFFVQQVDTVLSRTQDQHANTISMNDLLKECSFSALSINMRSFFMFTNGQFNAPANWVASIDDQRFNIKEHLGSTEDDFKFYSTPVAFNFNLNAIDDPQFATLPPHISKGFENFKDQFASFTPKILWYNMIYFIGDIVDRSGRAVHDAREFFIKQDPNSGPAQLYDYTTDVYRLENYDLAGAHDYMNRSEVIASAVFGFTENSRFEPTNAFNHGWYLIDDVSNPEILTWTWAHSLDCVVTQDSFTFIPGLMTQEAQYFYLKAQSGSFVTDTVNNLQHNLKLSYVYWLDERLIKAPYTQFDRENDIVIELSLPYGVQGVPGEYTRQLIDREFHKLYPNQYIRPAAMFQLRGY